MKEKSTELKTLENRRLLFTNYSEIAELKAQLEEYQYNEEAMKVGKALYDKAQAAYNDNLAKTSQTVEKRALFEKAYKAMSDKYKEHRKVAKVALKASPEALASFGLKGTMSRDYLEGLATTKKLYEGIKATTTQRAALDRFKLTEAVADEQLSAIAKVEEFRAQYVKLRGIDQQATQDKNKAFEAMNKWVKEFYEVAKIALSDRPQLLESIGKLVKS